MAAHFDRQDQYDEIAAGLLGGEELQAVFDCTGAGTGFVGITDKRVVLQDNSFIGGKSAVTSIPFGKIASVSFVSDKSILGRFVASSSIAISTGSVVREATFRGDDKARFIHDYILFKIM